MDLSYLCPSCHQWQELGAQFNYRDPRCIDCVVGGKSVNVVPVFISASDKSPEYFAIDGALWHIDRHDMDGDEGAFALARLKIDTFCTATLTYEIRDCWKNHHTAMNEVYRRSPGRWGWYQFVIDEPTNED